VDILGKSWANGGPEPQTRRRRGRGTSEVSQRRRVMPCFHMHGLDAVLLSSFGAGHAGQPHKIPQNNDKILNKY
jgi:hypothetical protein